MQIAIPSLRVVGNFLASDKQKISRVVLEANIIGVYGKMIDHPKQIMRKEVCWSLANICADSIQTVQACLSQGVIQSLIMHLQHDVNMVRRECVWALTNALSKSTPDLVKAIVELGYLTSANYALDLPDPRLLFVALDGISYALKAGMQMPLEQGENPIVLAIERCGLLDKIEEI